jgi:hypothetical protein
MLAGSLYLLSTAAFAVISLAIGVRLVKLAGRTGETPEFSLGMGLILAAALGYGVLITVSVLRAGAEDPGSSGLTALTILGKMLHNLGVMYLLLFIVTVFRPGESWARWLAYAMCGVLWIGFAGVCLTGGLETGKPGGFWYWIEFSVIGTYPAWGGIESFRYYLSMRRRLKIGLAEPLLVNRFLLWSAASVLSIAAIWTVMLPALLEVDPVPGSPFVAGCLFATSLFGIACVSTYWITFFPPRWYSAWLSTEPSTH